MSEDTIERQSKDPSKSVAAVWIPIIVALSVAAGGSFTWVYDKVAESNREENERKQNAAQENQRLMTEYLSKIHIKLKESKSLSDQLDRDFCVEGWGILESYVQKATADGHDKHSLMFGLISELVQRNSEILALLDGYEPHAMTDEFKTQADKFREHARVYIIRFNAIPKTVQNRQQLPKWKEFPVAFPSAVASEIAARSKELPFSTAK